MDANSIANLHVTSADGPVSLQGRRVLVIEDEPLIGMLVGEMLEDLGCVMAGSASRMADALELARSAAADIAILDLNLDGQKSFAAADLLVARGVRVVWISGATDAISAPYDSWPALAKPFDLAALKRVLELALAAPSAGQVRDAGSIRTRPSRN